MRKPVYYTAVLLAALLIAGCNKDSNVNLPVTSITTSNPVGQYIGGAPALPATASGGLYAINSVDVNGANIIATGAAFAWFGNATNTLDAGVVDASGDTLLTYIPGSQVSYPWYEGQAAAPLSDTVVWNSTGGAVAGFRYSDANNFPVVTNYNLPSSVSISAPLTVSYTVNNPFDVIVFTLAGSKGVVTQTATSAGPVTFSVAQLDSATAAGDAHVSLQIMPVKTTGIGVGGKAYYVVKQYAYKQYTSVTL